MSLRLQGAPATSFRDLLCWVTHKFAAADLRKFLVLVWALCMARNEMFINKQNPNFSVLCHGFLKMVDEYAGYAVVVHPVRQPVAKTESFDKWYLQPTRMLKVNFDAAMLGDGLVGLGCVGRNDKGDVVWMASKTLPRNWDVFMAESAAACFGVTVAKRLGLWMSSLREMLSM